MKLIEYITGSRRGRGANRLEREAMADPFLADAIEGYDSVSGNHSGKVSELSRSIELRARKTARVAMRRRVIARWSVAAVLLLGISATLLYIYYPKTGLQENSHKENMALASATPTGGKEVSERGDNTVESHTFVPASVSGEDKARHEDTAAPEQGGLEEMIAMDREDAHVVDFVYNDAGCSLPGCPVAVSAPAAPIAVAVCSSAVMQEELLAGDPLPSEPALARKMSSSEDSVAASGKATYENFADAISGKMICMAVPDSVVAVYNYPRFKKYCRKAWKEIRKRRKGLEKGTVVIEFRVNEESVPVDIEIVSGISPEVDEEAMNIVLSWPSWERSGKRRIRVVMECR